MLKNSLIIGGLFFLWGNFCAQAGISVQATPTLEFNLKAQPNHRVALISPLSSWTGMPMKEISPGKYRIRLDRPWIQSLPYKFSVNGVKIFDPANPERGSDWSGGTASIRETGFQNDTLLDPNPNVPPWTRTQLNTPDPSMVDDLIVYSPPRALFANRKSITLYFQDGDAYLDEGVANLLANLSQDKNLPLFTGVFVNPIDRDKEYIFSESFVALLINKIGPQVESMFLTGGVPADRILIGASLGGLASVFTALRYPKYFGKAAAQSGSFWEENGAILPDFKAASGEQLSLYFDIGTYETDRMKKFSEDAFQAARAAGISVSLNRFPAIHDFTCWRNRLQGILRYFYPAVSPTPAQDH